MWTPIENILPRLLNFLIMWTVIAAIPLKRYWDVRFSPLWTMISPFNSLNEIVRKGFSLVSCRTKFWIFIQFFRKPFLSTPPDQSFFFVFLSLIVWLEKNAKPSLLMTKSSFSSETSYGTYWNLFHWFFYKRIRNSSHDTWVTRYERPSKPHISSVKTRFKVILSKKEFNYFPLMNTNNLKLTWSVFYRLCFEQSQGLFSDIVKNL